MNSSIQRLLFMLHKCSDTMIVIGAGIAGLAAGCYAQMNGYKTQIFEMHDRPGGLCTAWQRQGFVFDGCIHYLFGSARGQPFYQLWEELGIVPQQQFVHHDELLRVSESDGKTLIVYSNPDSRSERLRQRLEQHLKEIYNYFHNRFYYRHLSNSKSTNIR